jgi:hypothetical protein
LDLGRRLRSKGCGSMQAKRVAAAVLLASGGGLTGQLAGDGQWGLPATKCDEESTEMKRRTRGTHLGARKGGRGAGGADRQRGAELRRVPSGRRRCACEEGRGSGARSRGARGDPFIG